MKNSVKLATLMLVAAVLTLAHMVTGCAVAAKAPRAVHATHKHSQPSMSPEAEALAKGWKPTDRCKTLAKGYSSNVAVIVQKDCLKRGVTTVGIVVLNNKDNGKAAAKDAVGMVIAALGYKPALAALVIGKAKGKAFMLSVVTSRPEVAYNDR